MSIREEILEPSGMDAINDSIVVIDQDGNPMMNSIIWLDRRAENEIKEVEQRVSADRVSEVTGLNLDSSHTAAKMLWVKKNRPEKSLINVKIF